MKAAAPRGAGRFVAWAATLGLYGLVAFSSSCGVRSVPPAVRPVMPAEIKTPPLQEPPVSSPVRVPASPSAQAQAPDADNIAAREVLVRFAPGTSEADISREVNRLQAEVLRVLPALRLYRLRIPADQTVGGFLAAQRDNPVLQRVEANPLVRVFQSSQPPNDPYFESQWGLKRIGIPAAWEATVGRPDVVVAVIDTGVDASHPDLQGQFVPGTNVLDPAQPPDDQHGHGTAMAGIIAASTNNGVGIAGICPGCRVMPVKALDASGTGTYADVMEGVIYAADHGARVLNLSVGGTAYSNGLRDAIEYARAAGAMVVAAAGNSGTDTPVYPAAYAGVLGVAAVDRTDAVWPGSNRGPHVSLAAPGVDITTTGVDGTYVNVTGTSPATAHVAGVVGLVALLQGSTALQTEQAVMVSALDVGEPGRDNVFGLGVVLADRSLGFRPSQPPWGITIASVDIVPRQVPVGEAARVEVLVRNESTTPVAGAILEVTIGGRAVAGPTVLAEVPGNATLQQSVSWTPDAKERGITLLVTVRSADPDRPNDRSVFEVRLSLEEQTGQLTIQFQENTHRAIAFQAAHFFPTSPTSPIARELMNGGFLGTMTTAGGSSDSGTTIIEGAIEEDNGLQARDHFWSPNFSYDAGISGFSSAVSKAQEYWGLAKRNYDAGNKSSAYWRLGRVAHLLTDMAVPAHVNLDPHLVYDHYESYVEDQYVPVRSGSPTNYHALDIETILAAQSPTPHPAYDSVLPSYQKTALFRLFLSLAETADDYESDDRNGEKEAIGHNKDGQYDTSAAECLIHADVLVPLAIQHVAGLYRLFFDEMHPAAALSNGGGVEGLVGQSESHFYKIPVPLGASRLIVTASTDSNMLATLYLRHGGAPSELMWNCDEEGVNTVCAETNPTEGDWLIGIVGGDGGATYSLSAAIEFSGPTPPWIVTASPLPAGTAGISYSKTLAASGGAAPYAWSHEAGVLPPGLEFIAGTISGTPTTLGTYGFRVKVTGDDGWFSLKDFTLRILPAQTTPSTATAGVSLAFLGEQSSAVGAGATVSFPGKDTSTASGGASVAFYGSLDQAVGAGASIAFQGSMNQVATAGAGIGFSDGPIVTSISPASWVAGAGGFTLQVTGVQFVDGAVVQWNGAGRPTTFVSATALSATIRPGDLAAAGPVAITVVNPAPGGGVSNVVTFIINATAATPTLTWPTPAPIAQGTALSETQLNATASIPGAYVYTPPAGTVLALGTHTLSVTFTPTDAVNYTTATTTVTIEVTTAVGGPAVRFDFDGDRKSDLLWRHVSQGDIWLWPMDGTNNLGERFVRMLPDRDWEIRGLGDQTGDGKADILWRNKVDGRIYLWPMDGSTPVDELYVATVDPAYDIVGTGDVDGDGKSDIVWRHAAWGDVWVWLMDGATSKPGGQVYIDRVDPAYVVKGVGDLDADTKADIVWHHATTGEVWVWPMNGTTRLDQVWVGTVPDVGYQIVGVADYTGEGKADLLWHHATRGEVWTWTMDGTQSHLETLVGTVPETDYGIVATGDYDGDTKADILWHHATRGEVWVWLMDGTTRRSEVQTGTVPDVGYQIVKSK